MATIRLLLIGAVASALPIASLAAQSEVKASAATTASADPAAEEIICKKSLETGSLVRKKKQCHTKAEWTKITESQVRGTRRMADEMMGGMQCDSAVQPC